MSGCTPIRFDPADAIRAYDHYLENCQRLGVEPMSWDRVQAQMAEWLNALATGHTTAPTDEPAVRRREAKTQT